MPQARNDRFIKEFQRRRNRVLHYFACSIVFVIVALGSLQLSDQTAAFLTIGSRYWRAFGVSQMLAAVVFSIIGFNQYRCPFCNEIVRGHDRYYLGIVFDPDECPHCGKPLK
jgi:hypothetical protein